MQRTTPYGAFLDLQDGTTALLHINNMANPDNLDNPQPRQLVNDGDKLTVPPRRYPSPPAHVRVQPDAAAELLLQRAAGVCLPEMSSVSTAELQCGFNTARTACRMLTLAGVHPQMGGPQERGAGASRLPVIRPGRGGLQVRVVAVSNGKIDVSQQSAEEAAMEQELQKVPLPHTAPNPTPCGENLKSASAGTIAGCG